MSLCRIIQQVLRDAAIDFEWSWIGYDPKPPPNFNPSNDLWLQCDCNPFSLPGIAGEQSLDICTLEELMNLRKHRFRIETDFQL
jgi:hypothetical protein